jgi:glycosyltransferase involved in cell wall biosynthesis
MKRSIAIIPCFNESRFIKNIVIQTKKYVDEVIVVDDNSKDDTVVVSKRAGAIVVENKSLIRGVGANTKRGIELALYNDADIIVTLDGDGQHNPDDIPKFIEPILNDKADLVIGDRFFNYREIPLYRRLGISVITYVYNLWNDVNISDSQCGFRAYSKNLLNSLVIEEKGFAFIIETLVKCRAYKFRIVEIPIVCLYHDEFKENHTDNPFKHGFDTLVNLIKWRIRIELLKK